MREIAKKYQKGNYRRLPAKTKNTEKEREK